MGVPLGEALYTANYVAVPKGEKYQSVWEALRKVTDNLLENQLDNETLCESVNRYEDLSREQGLTILALESEVSEYERVTVELRAEIGRLKSLVGVAPYGGFTSEFKHVMSQAYAQASAKGFWENPRSDGELIALQHAELSEALEALREGDFPSTKIPEFKHVEEEFADTVIRIMDHCCARKWRLAEAIIAKLQYNKTRPHKHGRLF